MHIFGILGYPIFIIGMGATQIMRKYAYLPPPDSAVFLVYRFAKSQFFITHRPAMGAR